MPTAIELAEQQSKHIDKLNVDIANLHKRIETLTKIIDEQVETITNLNEQLNTK